MTWFAKNVMRSGGSRGATWRMRAADDIAEIVRLNVLDTFRSAVTGEPRYLYDSPGLILGINKPWMEHGGDASPIISMTAVFDASSLTPILIP